MKTRKNRSSNNKSRKLRKEKKEEHSKKKIGLAQMVCWYLFGVLLCGIIYIL